MAQADRAYTGEMSVFTLDGDNELATFKNVTVHARNQMQESRAAKDSWRHRVTHFSEWDVDMSKAVEDEAAGTSLWDKLGDVVAMVLTSRASGGVTLSGNVIVRDLDHSFNDGEGQEQTPALEGQGALTIAYTA